MASRQHQIDVVVRIAADCPRIAPGAVHRLARQYSEKAPFHFACDTRVPQIKFPTEQDLEVISYEALERTW
jgi:spore coat polysaccharide biosynthesis protein SpsF (cytidylyltransferase family)